MKVQISSRFNLNIERARSLVGAYRSLSSDKAGRSSVENTDMLRAAVVFTHASLEELLRGLEEWKLPDASAETLNEIQLVLGEQSKRKFQLGDLAHHRGSSVNEVIQRSIRRHLERSNYNNPGDIKTTLTRTNGNSNLVEKYGHLIGPMMSRRHWIVHRADHNIAKGRGHHQALSLSEQTVLQWIDATEEFGTAIIQSYQQR